jgi:hypothetical protein
MTSGPKQLQQQVARVPAKKIGTFHRVYHPNRRNGGGLLMHAVFCDPSPPITPAITPPQRQRQGWRRCKVLGQGLQCPNLAQPTWRCRSPCCPQKRPIPKLARTGKIPTNLGGWWKKEGTQEAREYSMRPSMGRPGSGGGKAALLR